MSEAVDDPELTFYTIGKVAEIFEVTEQTVRTWIKKGNLVAVKLPNSNYRIRRQDLVEFAKNKYEVGTDDDE